MSHEDLQGLRRWLLATSTASGLYEKIGWHRVSQPEIFMEINNPDIYTLSSPQSTHGPTEAG